MKEDSSDIIIMIVSGTAVLLILLAFIISFSFLYKNRQVKYQREMESVIQHYNQEILKTQLEIREQTLKYIAEEIHDNVGQVLSLAVLNLSAIELSDTTRAHQRIERITGLVEKSVADLRNLSKAMDYENINQLGLAAAIAFELEMLEKTGMYKTSFVLSGQETKLTGSREIVIYRIIQESINNVIKHAKATTVNICLKYSPASLILQVIDNGTGINHSEPVPHEMQKTGSGIRNMKNRAEMIGALLTVQSEQGKGTCIHLNVPLTVNSLH